MTFWSVVFFFFKLVKYTEFKLKVNDIFQFNGMLILAVKTLTLLK